MSKPRIIVFYSGGKDSQATMIWAKKEYGDRVEAVFCDTGHESDITIKHVNETSKEMGVELVTLRSKKYASLFELAKHKTRFPSTMARYCTSELKIVPAIDFILDTVRDSCIFIQGIRAGESESRAKMSEACRYFKYYFTPTGQDNNGKDKYHTYRKKEVFEWCKKYDDSLIRPMFRWTAQEVINYILENGQQPNPLYRQGFSRVGCFPCIMCSQREIYQLAKRYPQRIEKIAKWEKKVGMVSKKETVTWDRQGNVVHVSTFFPPGKIPNRACNIITTVIDEDGEEQTKYVASIDRVVEYVFGRKPEQLFPQIEEEEASCMSEWGLCE